MEGVVVRQKNSLRVVLTMDLIMQSVSVEVDATELETLDSAVSSPEHNLPAAPSHLQGIRPTVNARPRSLPRAPNSGI
jgi:hypothetical protein